MQVIGLRHRPRGCAAQRSLEVMSETSHPSACSVKQVMSVERVRLLGALTVKILTVRLLIPSENAPICLTVTSESSICQQDKQTG